MRIDGTTNRANVNRNAKSKRSGAAGAVFRPETSQSSRPAQAQVPVAPSSGIEAILALQGVDTGPERKRNAVRHGQSLLDTLEEMKRDLLLGNVSEGRLHRLMALVTRARQEADPDLEALIDDIDLRAQVELAKFGMYAK
ncbi:MAG: flagellar assembly protein FliX [Devosiaceae bacterium]|nr:flagellar assembly protein FliX [Devosiaceae bacterium]